MILDIGNRDIWRYSTVDATFSPSLVERYEVAARGTMIRKLWRVNQSELGFSLVFPP